MPPSPPEFLLTPVNEPSCLPINYYYKLLCVDIGVHMHVVCTQAHACTCMHVCVVIEFSFSPLPPSCRRLQTTPSTTHRIMGAT